MDSETKAKLAGLVRNLLGFLAGLAIGKKWMDQETANALIEVGIGAVPVAMVAWSIWQKNHQVKLVEAALTLPASATLEDVHATVDAKK